MREVKASGSVTFSGDDAGTETEVRIGGIGLEPEPLGDEQGANKLRNPTKASTREQAAHEAHARASAVFSEDAPMRVRIATGARLLGATHD